MKTSFSPRISALLLILISGLVGSSTVAHAQQNLLKNGDFADGTESWTLPNAQKATTSVVTATGAGTNARALQLQTTPAPDDKPWNLILRQPLGVAIKNGEALTLRAWLRSPQSLKALMFLEAKDANYTKSLESPLQLSPQWKEFEVRGAAKGDYAAGDTSVGFHLGYGTGAVEITGVRLVAGQSDLVPVGAVAALPATPATDAATAPTSLKAPQQLLANGDFGAPLKDFWTANGPALPTLELVPGEPSFVRAQISLANANNAWDSRLTAAKTAVAIPANSLIAIRFRARSPQSLSLAAIFQEAVDPFNKVISQTAALKPQWKDFVFYGKTTKDLAASASNFEFHVGYGEGTIEIADVRVENYGDAPQQEVENAIGAQSVDYWGNAIPNDAWKVAALDRIEKHRKGDLKIRLVDAQNKPIPNAKVELVQTRQLFRWGTAVPAARLVDRETPDNLRLQNELARLFNTVTFENDLKWDNRNPRKTEQALEALKWLNAKNIDVRGHTLVWGSRRNLPPEAVAVWDDTEKLRALVRARVRSQAETFKGQVYVWDAVNEAVTNTELWEKLGWDEFANVYKIAREVDPNVKLAYNDYNISNENQNPRTNIKHRERVAELIQLLRDKGAPVDIYGDQAHFGLPLTTPGRMIEIWQEAAKIGLPIEITEFDAGIKNDELHGRYVSDALLAAFSVPEIQSFILWGFWEGAHWRADQGGAMFRRDWSKRPAQLEYERLVLNEWKTNATLTTDKDGVVQTRGFLGDYTVEISKGGRSLSRKFILGKSGYKTQLAF